MSCSCKDYNAGCCLANDLFHATIAVSFGNGAFSQSPDIFLPWMPSSVLIVDIDTNPLNEVSFSIDGRTVHGILIPGSPMPWVQLDIMAQKWWFKTNNGSSPRLEFLAQNIAGQFINPTNGK